jgi:hypothetical protein
MRHSSSRIAFLQMTCLFGIAASIVIWISSPVSGVSFSIGANFTDSNHSASGFIPPDTDGAVGPNSIGVLINGRWSVYNKTGGLLQSKSLDQFWMDAGVTPTGSFAYDPRIVYDSASGRWFASSLDNPGGVNNFLVAVSQGSDPTGSWQGFSMASNPTSGTHWADFDRLGFNNQVVTVSANMYPVGSGNSYTNFLVLPKADLLAGSVANKTLFENIDPNTTGYTAQPIVDRDNGNLPLPLLSAYNKDVGLLKTSSIGGTPSAPTLNTADGFIGVTARGSPPDLDQPGPKTNIDAGSNDFSSSVVKQNGLLWAVEDVEYNGRAAIEWYKIDPATNNVLQSGLIADPVLAFNYPSIAVNGNENVVIGFSGASPSTYVSTYVAVGETVGGVTTIGNPVLTKSGVSDYERLDGYGRNRWGDYSATVVDPAQTDHFWTFQEFVSSTDQWSVQVTEIVVPEPGSLTLLSLAAVCLFGYAWRRRKITV